MEKTNFRFNPRRYEEHLSILGRKVLNELVQKWESDHKRIQGPQHGCHQQYQHATNSKQNRRVLTFRDNETLLPPPPTIFEDINNHIQNDETPFDFHFTEPNIPHVSNVPIVHQDTTPTSIQPMQIVEAPSYTSTRRDDIGNNTSTNTGFGDLNMTSYDLINPVIEGRILTKHSHNYNNSLITAETSGDYKRNSDIDWDNMFDTELLSPDAAMAKAQLVLKQTEFHAANTFDIQSPREVASDKGTLNKNKIGKKVKGNVSKKSKSKNQPITDAIPKKVKKVPAEPKISFRKQKYTKAVKNWLNSVDPNNPVDDRDGDVRLNESREKVNIVIEKTNEKPNKKVIQAQLANKDGIMKFRKPKSKSFEKSELVQGYASSSPGEVITSTAESRELTKSLEKQHSKNLSKEKIPKENKPEIAPSKDKKGKPKFIAPIKSQIPVKEVVFQITTVDENCMDALKSIDGQEMVAVLVYRNGFCQLNKQHTDDICEPEGFLLNMDEEFYLFKEEQQIYKELLQSVLQQNSIVCYDGKSLLMYLKATFDLDIHAIKITDAEIGGSILDPDRPPGNFSELQKLVSFSPQYTIATESALQKAAWYCAQLRPCAALLVALLREEQLWHVFENIEMRLVPIIAEMESVGVAVDTEKLKAMEELLLSKMKITELECHKAAGRSFQVTSPAQIRALIYDELKLDSKCNIKIKETLAQGAKSTSETMLRGLVHVHALPRLVLEYRHLHKAHATFLAGIAHHVRRGLISPTWVQTAAATGRIASNNPNLQAIPKAPFSLVLFPEHAAPEHGEQETLNFRSVYVSRAGCVLVACDFKHVECRVFALHAGDRELLAALADDGDFFHLLAQKWLNKPAGEVSPEDRERTKRIVYASLYGAGVRKLMDILDVGYEQALAVQASFNRNFPSLKSFGSAVVSRCAEGGGRLASLAGRVRRVPNIASAEPALRAQAERQAVNFIIQGSAADLCKLAMVEACRRVRSHRPPLQARLLLQIHDELVWEVSQHQLHDAAGVIRRAMEECGLASGVRARLPVAVRVGRSWGEMAPYHAH